MKQSVKVFLTVLASVALLAVFFVAIRDNSVTVAETPEAPQLQPAALEKPREVAVAVPIEPIEEPAPEVAPEVIEAPPQEETDEPEPIHYYNGMDPEDQPRAFLHERFAGRSDLPSGYEAIGDDFRLSADGWTLTGPLAGVEDDEIIPRTALIESPPIELDFPVNAVTPLWREESPNGTEVMVEVSLSPDGENWTDWMPSTSAHYEGDMSPTYPDGSINPNYGYTTGEMTFYGLDQFTHFRYTVTLYSEVRESPTVSDFRLFYQDSTMGDGRIAKIDSSELAIPTE